MSAITNPAVEEVRGYIRKLSADEKARYLAEARAKALRDEASLLEDALKKGRAEGEARGEARGKAEGALIAKRETLQNLIKLKFGTHPDWVEQKLDQADKDQMEHWIQGILAASNLNELFKG